MKSGAWICPPFWLVPSSDATGTGQHTDTYLIIFFDINLGLFVEVFKVQATFFIKEFTLFVEACSLAVAEPFGKGGVIRTLVIGNDRPLFKLGNVSLDPAS